MCPKAGTINLLNPSMHLYNDNAGCDERTFRSKDWSDDLIKGIPASLGGSLKSKPMWSNTSGCSATSAFFALLGAVSGSTEKL